MKRYLKVAMAVLCMASAPFLPVHASQAGPVALGDEWVFHQAVETPGKPVVRAAPRFQLLYANTKGGLVMSVTSGESGAGRPLWRIAYQLDPSACLVDIVGGEPLRTERACELPEPGKSWAFDDRNSVSHIEERYTVLGREMVQVGAGNFEAVKVEVRRMETEVPYPNVESAPPQRTRTVYWFAPEAKSAVKVVRERFDPSGARTSVQTEELQRFGNAKLPR